jgi:hypothetical protein
MNRSKRERRLRIFETNYGRYGGWYLEHHGRRIGALTDYRWAEMFWDSYKVEALSEDSEDLQLLTSPLRWPGEVVFRSREFGEAVPGAFPWGQGISQEHRVEMRALYIRIKPPSLWERVRLWWRGSRQAAMNA